MNPRPKMVVCLLTAALLLGALPYVAEAKKPPTPEPPSEREAPVTYAIHWFQGPGGVFTRAKDVNSFGVAVGWSGDGGFVYFLEDQTFYFLDDIADWPAEWGEGWHFNRGTRITDSGLVAGIIEDYLGTYRVFVGELAMTEGGPVLRDLALVPFDPAYPAQWPNDLSENGIVTGSLSDGRYSIGFVAEPGYSCQLVEAAEELTGINPQGTVAVGFSARGEGLTYDIESNVVTTISRKNKVNQRANVDISSSGVIMARLSNSNLHQYTFEDGWQEVPGSTSQLCRETNNVGHTTGGWGANAFVYFGSIDDPVLGYWLIADPDLCSDPTVSCIGLIEGMSNATETTFPLLAGYGDLGACVLLPVPNN